MLTTFRMPIPPCAEKASTSAKRKVWTRINSTLITKIDMHQDNFLVASIHVQDTPEGVCYALPPPLLYLKLLALGSRGRYEEPGGDQELNKDWDDIRRLFHRLIGEGKRWDSDFDRITETNEQHWLRLLTERRSEKLKGWLSEIDYYTAA